jgi:hypothetical protein
MRTFAALLVLSAAPAFAQLHFGVKGGAAFNDLVSPAGNLESRFRKWTLGPMAELDLPLGLGAEINALYRSTGYSAAQDFTAGSWEFPLLARYRFPGVGVRPFVGAGWSFRSIGDIPRFSAGSQGFILSGGVRINAVLFKLSPEIRYTRWNSGAECAVCVKASRNQVEGLIGLFF